jgi:RNA polymerase sigma-70 factor, ECF subfamily
MGLAASVRVMEGAHPVRSLDREAEGRRWIAALRATGAEREVAAATLHAMLLRAARFELGRRGPMLAGAARETIDDLAMQSADDALSAILGKLDTYRFESRFTTWAYKFAILEAAVRTRRRAWERRELPIDVLAERLGTTRGALYKTLHDARRKLRTSIGADDDAIT